jgi:hypothetical protein
MAGKTLGYLFKNLPGDTLEAEFCCVVAEQLQPYGHVIALGAVCDTLAEHTGEVSQAELIPAATAAATQACNELKLPQCSHGSFQLSSSVG